MPGRDCAIHGKEPYAHLANLKFRCTSDEEKAKNVNSTLAQIHARLGRRGIAAACLSAGSPSSSRSRRRSSWARALTPPSAASAPPTRPGSGSPASASRSPSSPPPDRGAARSGSAAAASPSPTPAARYGVGSLVNTLVPFRAGDAVRIGLFCRALPTEKPLWTTGGAFAALGAARAVVLGALVVAGYLSGAVPIWPLLIAVGLVAAAVGRRDRLPQEQRAPARRLPLARRPSRSAPPASSPGSRSRPAAASSPRPPSRGALDLPHPLAAAIVIIPALDVAGLIPLTPGNLGITSAAIAVALQAQGTSFTNGLAAGIAFHAVETAVGLMFGIASLVWMAPYPSPAARRVALLAGAGGWVLGIAGAFGATVLVPLV